MSGLNNDLAIYAVIVLHSESPQIVKTGLFLDTADSLSDIAG
jgi:hypothetical protein